MVYSLQEQAHTSKPAAGADVPDTEHRRGYDVLIRELCIMDRRSPEHRTERRASDKLAFCIESTARPSLRPSAASRDPKAHSI